MKKIIYAVLFFICSSTCLSSCVSRSRLVEANKIIDSLKVENARLLTENYELLNGEERLVNLYKMNVSKGNYIAAEENYNNLIKYHPESISINQLQKSINDVLNKAQSQRDSIAKIIKDSIRLAKIDELGDWRIGEYVNDFDEPTGEHYVYQTILGKFSNSATAGSDLHVRMIIRRESQSYIRVDTEYDEYMDGTIDEKNYYLRRNSAIKIVCHKTRKVYYNDAQMEALKENGTCNYTDILPILKQGGKIEFRVKDDYSTVYYFTVQSDYLENALLKAGIETL
jgi:hypothetical protein